MKKHFMEKLLKKIWEYAEQIDEIKIMEVCGTHTQSIAKHGIASLLPQKIKLLSGPGCPVCVTPASYIDDAIRLLGHKDVVIATFGDMVRVKGKETSLDKSDIKNRKPLIVYSPFDIIKIAEVNRDKMVIFLAVGFETTTPAIASLIKFADEKSIDNINIMTSLRLMPPILEEVLKQNGGKLHGIICPGHVAAVMGEKYFQFLPKRFGIHSVISGFGAEDILCAVYILVQGMYKVTKPVLNNIYKKCVSFHGNEKAKTIMEGVFKVDEGIWRGIGLVPDSALVLKEEYAKYDAARNFGLTHYDSQMPEGCSCSEILMGKKLPNECSLFGSICNPVNPYGPCMVSSEGSCSIYYKFRR